jgi:ATP-binding cassette subfamily B protein
VPGSKRPHTKPIFEVHKLSYKTPESHLPILKDLNLTLYPRDRLGILGPLGAGKSTLLQLLAGFEENFEGEILFHSRPIRTLSHSTLRQRISIVPQKSFLFANTIRANICLDKELSDAQIWHYLSMACVDNDVKAFPQGLETRIGEWGVTLSGGQKQRLTLARALARKPEVLLLDDCLSAVDTITEDKILNALKDELRDTTLIWVAHRKSTLKYCNQILELSRET